MNKDRKQDTYEKIQLGGLVVKAGLRNADKNIILGALTDLATSLELSPDGQKINKYKKIGQQKFKS